MAINPPQLIDDICIAIIRTLNQYSSEDSGPYLLDIQNKIPQYKPSTILNRMRYLELCGLVRKVKDKDTPRSRYYLILPEFRIKVFNEFNQLNELTQIREVA